MLNRRTMRTFLAGALLAMTSCGGSPTAESLHASESWYQDHPAEEEIHQGRIERLDRVLGPESRGGLTYQLVTEQGAIPIYAANAPERLARYDGEDVVIHGKTAKLEGEGQGIELWVGRIALAEN